MLRLMNRQQSWQAGGVALVSVVVGVSSCTQQHAALAADQREAIQNRVASVFPNVALFKPAADDLESPLAVQLAPLLIQEVSPTNGVALERDQTNPPAFPAQIFCDSGTVLVNHRSHQQFSYTWNHSAGNASAEQKTQGVRLTLNAAGAPVIWEVRSDSSGADILYVAQSLELAARAELGPPLPGRKFSSERALAEAPNTVVANVIEDGPVVMGPIVYLAGERGDVAALICRCMAAQFQNLLGQKEYELIVRPASNQTTIGFPPGPLEARLRLPKSF
jgi:hypothetical protein